MAFARPWPAASGRSKRAISWSRPTSGVRPPSCRASKRPSARPFTRTRQARHRLGKALEPLGCPGPRARTARSTSRRVGWPMTTLPGVGQRLQSRRKVRRFVRPRPLPALPLRRSARRPPPAPVAMPTRACSGSSPPLQPRRPPPPAARPALTARSASSSCACGPAEIRQHAIAHVFGDMAAPTLDHLGAASLISRR